MDLTRWLQRPPVLRELPDEVAAVVTGSRPYSATGSRHADTWGWDADARPHLATSGQRPATSSRIGARRHLAARPRKKGERGRGGRRRESTGGGGRRREAEEKRIRPMGVGSEQGGGYDGDFF
uniref:Uncharacterized protein n=1 Tax=Oryza glaberrima TaxID=4538 RepID=I1QMU6_ORYGL